jgi:high-affinity Fe2+/Pb2+ permease
VAIVVVAVALLGLSLGWLLDRRGGGSTLADRLRFTSHFLLRAYVAVILGWSAWYLPVTTTRFTSSSRPFSDSS